MQEIGISKSQKPLQRVAVIALGWVFIVLGIVGLVLPVVPGAVLIVVGALMVNPQWAWFRRMLEKCRARFPVLDRPFTRFSDWGERRQSRFGNDPDDSGSRSTV